MALSFNAQIVPLSEVPCEQELFNDADRRPVVLIVDDERIIADSLAAILSREGFAAYSAYDGDSAVALAAEIEPELLISDVAMPDMNGVELAVLFSDLQPDCKVLLISGHATSVDLLRAHEAGHTFSLLSKPIHPAEMLRHVARSLKITPKPARVIEPIGRGFFSTLSFSS